MGHPVKNRLHCKKVGHTVKYGSNLEKWAALKWVTFWKRWVALRNMENISKNGALCKNMSHCGKWVTLKKWVTFKNLVTMYKMSQIS